MCGRKWRFENICCAFSLALCAPPPPGSYRTHCELTMESGALHFWSSGTCLPPGPPPVEGITGSADDTLSFMRCWGSNCFVQSKQALYHLSCTPQPSVSSFLFSYTVISRPQMASARRNSNATKAGTQEEEAGALFSSRTSAWPVSLLKIIQMYFAKNPSQIIWHVSVNQQENKTHSEENMCIIIIFFALKAFNKQEEFELFS